MIIKGIAETGPNENAHDLVVKFFKDSLMLSDPESVVINNVHRLGKPPHLTAKAAKNPRDIIIRFQSAMDRGKIWKHRFNLKGTKFILTEDFSPATQEKVRKLQPYLRAAKQCPQVSRSQLVRDVLVINDQKFTVDSLHLFPHGLNDANPAERHLKDGKGIAFFGKASFLSNFYESSFEEQGVTYKTVKHYYQAKKPPFSTTCQLLQPYQMQNAQTMPRLSHTVSRSLILIYGNQRLSTLCIKPVF